MRDTFAFWSLVSVLSEIILIHQGPCDSRQVVAVLRPMVHARPSCSDSEGDTNT